MAAYGFYLLNNNLTKPHGNRIPIVWFRLNSILDINTCAFRAPAAYDDKYRGCAAIKVTEPRIKQNENDWHNLMDPRSRLIYPCLGARAYECSHQNNIIGSMGAEGQFSGV